MTDKHTPGPWTVDVVRFSNATTRRIFAGEKWIARLLDIEIDRPQADADARLIAAAPNMLAALDLAADELERLMTWHGTEVRASVLRDARAAIAEARDARAAIAEARGTQ